LSTIATIFHSPVSAAASFLAQSTAPAGGASQGFGSILASPLLPIMAVVVIMMVMSGRTKRKQDKARQELLSKMKRGDRVQTIGGILGNVVEVRDNDVLVKVDESSNTKIKFARSAVTKVITEEDKVDSK
jgi:preprotein translocase subunit YajC